MVIFLKKKFWGVYIDWNVVWGGLQNLSRGGVVNIFAYMADYMGIIKKTLRKLVKNGII